jgi:hypothetical protein
MILSHRRDHPYFGTIVTKECAFLSISVGCGDGPCCGSMELNRELDVLMPQGISKHLGGKSSKHEKKDLETGEWMSLCLSRVHVYMCVFVKWPS